MGIKIDDKFKISSAFIKGINHICNPFFRGNNLIINFWP